MLKLNIFGNVDITPAIQDAIHNDAQCLDKFLTSTVLNIDVHVKKEHKTQFAVALTTGGKSVTANAADLYKAITDSFQKLETVLGKDKSVMLHRRKHAVVPVQEDLTEDEE